MTPSALAHLHAASFPGERAWSEAEFEALLSDPGIVLEVDGPAFLLGRVVLDEAEILTVATASESRRQGHGRRLLDAFHERATGRGATSAFLEVAADNDAALGLYFDRGYTEVGRRPRYYRRTGGILADALILRRDLL